MVIYKKIEFACYIAPLRRRGFVKRSISINKTG